MADPENASKRNHDWPRTSVLNHLLRSLEIDRSSMQNQQGSIEAVKMDLLKEENVGLRLVNFIMFPSKTLQNSVSTRALPDPQLLREYIPE